MAYNKTTWIDRNVSTPDNYVVTKVGGGVISSGDTVTMTESAGVVTQDGTDVNASNLNKIETGIDEAHAWMEDPTYATVATVTQEVTSLASTILKGKLTAEIQGNTQTPYDQYTKLLMRFEGSDTSSTFVDATGKTVTPSGNAQIDTAQYKFGSSSGLFDGTGDYLTVTDANNDLDIGTSDFCIEAWVRFNSVASSQHIVEFKQVASTDVAPSLLFSATTGKLKLNVANTDVILGTTTIAINTWYHIVIARSIGTTKLFVNGGQEGSSYTDSNNYIPVSTINIGASFGGTLTLNGWLDDFRISVGTPRYTSNFSPLPLQILSSDKIRVLSVGKNILQVAKGAITQNGITITSDGETITINGTASAQTRIQIPKEFLYGVSAAALLKTYPVLKFGGNSHTLSYSSISGSYSGTANMAILDSAGNSITKTSGNDTLGTDYAVSGSYDAYALYINAANASSFSNYSFKLQIEKGAKTTYTAYTETSAVFPSELKRISSTIYDTWDANLGKFTKNTEKDTDVSSTQYDSLDTATYTNVDVVKTTAFSSAIAGTTAVDGKTLVINKDGKKLTEVASADIDTLSSVGKYYYHTDKSVWFIVANGAYANIGDARTGLGTSQVFYQLATPVVTNYYPNVLNSEPSGTIYVEPYVEDCGIYDGGITVTDTNYPIASLDYVSVIDTDTGTLTPIALSTCTVGTTSFTSTAISAGDYVVYGYKHQYLSTVATMAYITTANLKTTVDENTNNIRDLDVKLEQLEDKTNANDITIRQKLERYGASVTGNDSYVVNNTYQTPALYAGMMITFKADVSNTGAATINVDGLGAKDLKKMTHAGKVALVTGDIIAGGVYNAIYDGTDFITSTVGGGGTYQIADTTLSQTSAQIDIGTFYAEYDEILLYFINANISASQAIDIMKARFNDDSGNNYMQNNGNTLSSYCQIAGLGGSAFDTPRVMSFTRILNVQTAEKPVFYGTQASGLGDRISAWVNTTNRISKISLYPNTDVFDIGMRVIVLGVKWG